MNLRLLLLLGALLASAAAPAQTVRRALPANPQAPAAPAAPAASAAQLIRTGDLVDIAVFKHDELGYKGPVGADGCVALQFIGSIPVAGLTPDAARRRIEARYADGWLRRPQVRVSITEYQKASFTVSGQVNRPGTWVLPRNRTVTLLEAIGTAGSFNTRANQRTVLLKRGSRTLEVDVRKILRDPRHDVPLQDGDVVWVKEAAF